MKLKVPTCSHSRVGHLTAAQREEKGTGTGGPCAAGTEGGLTAQVLCPHGTPAEDHVFLLPAFVFPQLCSECVPSGTSSARPVQESKTLRSEQSTLQWALKVAHREHFHEDQGLQEPVGFKFGVVLDFCFGFFISSFSRRDVQCFTQIPICHHSFKRCNAIQITLKWEKNAKLCFPFICETLRRVLLVYVLSGLILYCFGHVALMTSLHQALGPSEETRSPAPQ